MLGSMRTIDHSKVLERSELHTVGGGSLLWKLLAVLPHSYFNAVSLCGMFTSDPQMGVVGYQSTH